MLCAVCGSDKVTFCKNDGVKRNEAGRVYKGVSYYCDDCALAFLYDYSGNTVECAKCGTEVPVERAIRDCDSIRFCSERCMFAYHNMKRIPEADKGARSKSAKSGLFRGSVKGGVIEVWRSDFQKGEIAFRLSIAEIDSELSQSANSNAVLYRLVRNEGRHAIERWIESSPTPELAQQRRDLWDGDICGDDDAVRVVTRLYELETGSKPATAYERHTNGAGDGRQTRGVIACGGCRDRQDAENADADADNLDTV